MSTLLTFGQRQQSLLKALLHKRSGLTVDELSQALEISRNAVNQHIASLERNDFIQNTSLSTTGGRPSRIYTLTEQGLELFPKHYALFSNLLVRWIREKLGDAQLKSCLAELGNEVAQEFLPRIQQKANLNEKVNEVAHVMYELGYEAKGKQDANGNFEITANNCVFHQLANEYNEVCELDTTLLSTLLNADIDHKECMVKGGQCCRFAIKKI